MLPPPPPLPTTTSLRRTESWFGRAQKINAKNTWSLELIDHISDIIKSEREDQTNFQKVKSKGMTPRASCTLDAGVKIYASRVDSVHTDTFKILGGLTRSRGSGENGAEGEGGEDGDKKRAHSRKTVNTLEQSADSIRMKKLDLSVVVDPLFHKTSAQFDEARTRVCPLPEQGGASGLLLNTLGVYHGCDLIFDGEQIPDNCSKETNTEDVELSLSEGHEKLIAQLRDMVAGAGTRELSPTLAELNALLHGSSRRPLLLPEPEPVDDDNEDSFAGIGSSPGIGGFEDGDALSDDDQGLDVLPDENGFGSVGTLPGDGPMDFRPMSGDMTLEWISNAAMRRTASWAGPEHWRYRAPPRDISDAPKNVEENEEREKSARSTARFNIDFVNPPDVPPNAFDIAEKDTDITLKSQAGDANTLLPDDLHYHPKMLARLFLRPLYIGGHKKRAFDDSLNHGETQGFAELQDAASDDDEDFNNFGESGLPDAFDAFQGGEDDEDDVQLLQQGRHLEKIEVPYAKAAKQVDVRALKTNLWEGLTSLALMDGTPVKGKPSPVYPFERVLEGLSARAPAAFKKELPDVSVHLAFICLLHLCNEHSLKITVR
eukprot:scaffold2536_cov378-Prasinococcus_capsulatus_cf.AAC.2